MQILLDELNRPIPAKYHFIWNSNHFSVDFIYHISSLLPLIRYLVSTVFSFLGHKEHLSWRMYNFVWWLPSAGFNLLWNDFVASSVGNDPIKQAAASGSPVKTMGFMSEDSNLIICERMNNRALSSISPRDFMKNKHIHFFKLITMTLNKQ